MKRYARERINGPDITKRLGYERYRREISILEMADVIGVSRQALSRYEREVTEIPFWVVESMCKALDLRIVIYDKKGSKFYENV